MTYAVKPTDLIRALVEGLRRCGAVKVLRFASTILRGGMALHRQGLISYGGLRIVLSVTRFLQWFGGLLALGRRGNRKNDVDRNAK